jgi:photosystem II stability/assembly factor-like uncharacterized protein
VYSTGTNKGLYDIHFVNTNTGWAVGDSTVVKSTNGGVNWIRQNCFYNGTSTPLYSVRFLNENTGYTAGGFSNGQYAFNNYVFKTTNGGVNWNLIFDQQNFYNGYIHKIFPINENIIFISLSGVIELNSLGGLYKSINGGLNFSFCLSYGSCNSVYFLNSNTGWSTIFHLSDFGPQKTYICKTTDGGSNWNVQFQDSVTGIDVMAVQFVNENTGFALGNKSYNKTVYFRTSNSGVNWDTITYNHMKSVCLFFINQNTGWIAGEPSPDSSSIAYTSNGGSNWTLQNNYFYIGVRNLFFIDNLTGWATIYTPGSILKTVNGGITHISNYKNEEISNYTLYQNYPNPFNPVTKIKFEIAAHSVGQTFLSVYDLLGREIETLVNEPLQPGTYEVTFNGGNYSSGIYFYQLRANDFIGTKKLVLLK